MKLINARSQNLRKIAKKIKNKINNLLQRITIASMIGKVAVLSIILAAAPLGTIPVRADNGDNIIKTGQAEDASNVKINFSQAYPLWIEQRETKSFTLVESEYDRREREKREAEERARQEAESQKSRSVVSREVKRAPVDADLAAKRALVKRAAAKYGIDWKILEAVWQVESGKAWDTSVKSYAGAGGPMQFMPSTWRKYAQDGNGDGTADMYSAEDAVFGAAQLLAQSGAAAGDITSALLSYNHAMWYVDKVKGVAASIQD